MTDYLDSDTIATVATVSATETYQSVDSATINPKTTVTSVDAFAAINALTISGVTSVSAVEQQTSTIAANTIATTTTITWVVIYATSIHSTDYDNNALVGYYTYDSSYPIQGSVGLSDSDDGLINTV